MQDIKYPINCNITNALRNCLPVCLSDLNVYGFDCIDSTNSFARSLLDKGIVDPTVILSNGQTDGRGRRGKSFYSPSDTGLYMTLMYCADRGSDFLRVTSKSAVALYRSILNVTGTEVGIKWVNDIYLNGKKVAGILSELVQLRSDPERNGVIVGIGINLSTSSFPPDIKEVAGSLNLKTNKYELASEIIKELYTLLILSSDNSYMEDYRKHSIILDKEITYERNGIIRKGIASSINDNGALLVLLPDGTTDTLSSGEISVRTLKS